MITSKELCFVVAVNDEKIFELNFKRSKNIEGVAFIKQKGYCSAAQAYNEAIDHSENEYLVFLHQDVYLPPSWVSNLLYYLNKLNNKNINWGVIGIAGVNKNGEVVGRLWSQGINREINNGNEIEKVYSLDEVVIVLRKSTGLRFDENLSGFHLYGTDIVMQSAQKEYDNFVIHLPVIHNDKTKYLLDFSYLKAYWYMRNKWYSFLPIPTTCVTITKLCLPFFIRNIKQIKRLVIKNKQIYVDPIVISKKCNYE